MVRRAVDLSLPTRRLFESGRSWDRRLGQLVDALDASAAGQSRMRDALARQERETQRLREELLQRAGELANLRQSTSWKLTAPLRAMVERLPARFRLGLHQRLAGLFAALAAGRARRRLRRLIADSGLFDADFYRAEYPQTALSGLTPLDDYLDQDPEEGRRPNPLFDPLYYAGQVPGLRDEAVDPLAHFIRRGAWDGCRPSPFFDPAFYRAEYPDVARAGDNPLRHYLDGGARAGRRPCALDERDLDPRVQALRTADLSDPRLFEFDAELYTGLYPDLAALAPAEAAQHFRDRGEGERRIASPGMLVREICHHPLNLPIDFSCAGYLDRNPDLREIAGRHPLWAVKHYMGLGRHEARRYRQEPVDLAPAAEAEAPLAAARRSVLSRTTVCVLVHLFDTDVWPDLARYIRNLDRIPHDLWINLVETTRSDAIEQQVRRDFPQARILVSPNQGRDIGGFMALLSQLDRSRYETYCLIHSKKSRHLPTALGAGWRRDLLEAILADRATALDNLAGFFADRSIGLVGSARWRDDRVMGNQRAYRRLLDLLEIRGENRHCDFLAGTIMMVRAPVLNLIHERIAHLSFEAGDARRVQAQIDGQLAHAVERVIGNVVRHLGYRMRLR